MNQQPIHLVLPWPVSANRYWRSFVPKGHKRAIVTLSDEAKAYKEQVSLLAWQQGVREPLEGRLQVEIDLYPYLPRDWAKRARKSPEFWDDTVQCLDLDNTHKVLLDSLKGVALVDDKWVFRIASERMEPDGEGRVVIRIDHFKRNSGRVKLEQPEQMALVGGPV
jgi:crossover junction endodeoxyribonuclease RusA